MRSLTLTGLHIADFSSLGTSSHATTVTVDPESGICYVTIERLVEEGVEVDIVQMDPSLPPSDLPEVVATLSSPVLAPYSRPNLSEILDLRYFADDRSLVVILAGGDIATIQLGNEVSPVEIVGSVDSGIKAAAWSPDEEQLVLVTGEDNVVCMTRLFDLIHEEPLRSEEFGEDQFINVGWGSKQTQFHGSLGKAAAQAPDPAVSTSTKPASLSHPTDDGLPTITFRGDTAFFAISSLDPYPSSPYSRRQIRIYSRSAGSAPKLSATSEVLLGLEGPLSWRPSGNLISGLIRYGYEGGGVGPEGKWDVAMMERNGLRHGGFELRETVDTWQEGRVKEMGWNSDSEVLAIWIERKEEDVVQLWSMKNYHYYLKQELFSHKPKKRFTGFKWHPEHALTLYLIGKDSVQVTNLVWETYTTRQPIPHDTASVAVVDGKRLLITPFRTQNVPPPMSSYHLDLPSTPVHVSLSQTADSLAMAFSNGSIQYWDLNTRLPDPKGSPLRQGGKAAEPKLRWECQLEDDLVVKQLAVRGDEVGVLAWRDDECLVISVREGKRETLTVDAGLERLVASDAKWLLLDRDGALSTTGADDFTVSLCAQPLFVSFLSDLIFALSPSGKLLLTSLSNFNSNSTSHTLASSVTSFTLTTDFLIYTTSAQMSHYAPIPTLSRLATGEIVEPWEMEWETRRIERGALAVVACPSSMSLVLQMPRGNLEAIYPRPLVLAVVRRDVLAGAYRKAFVTCRKHRLDLNIIHDLDPRKFMANLESFIDQIPEMDYLNLFISSLKESDSSPGLYRDLKRNAASSKTSLNKVNAICDAIRSSLEQRDMLKYTETILTAHVCKVPADYESGLGVLLHLQKDHPDVVEDAIKYIIFLSDVNKIYDVALGMYDFQLVLMVAQYSQKDPKEYLPFLRELRALDKWEQRFRIDDHLGRREKALRSLQQAGPSRSDEAADYLSRYELYDEGFKLYKDDHERLPAIYDLYGDYLYDRRDFHEAAIAYTFASNTQKTLKAYEKAHAWRELFTLAKEENVSQPSILEMVGRVTDHLSSRGKHLEASQVFIEYADDVDDAIEVLCQGAEFSEAYRIASLHSREDFVEKLIRPGLEDAQESLVEVFEEMEGQLDKEVARLEDLKKIRSSDPDTFYIVDNEPALEGVDIATNASTAVSAFTRYTVAPTTVFSQTTKMTGQTNRTRHKASKKRAAGRKGTVDEYEYLLLSLGRLVVRVDEKSADAMGLLRHLVHASNTHRDLASDLQSTIIALRSKLANALEEAWRDREEILDGVEESGGMGLDGGTGLEKARESVIPMVVEWKGLGVLGGLGQ